MPANTNSQNVYRASLAILIVATIIYQLPINIDFRRIGYSLLIASLMIPIFAYTKGSTSDIRLSRFSYYMYLTHYTAIVSITAFMTKGTMLTTTLILITTMAASALMMRHYRA